jgi:hypothetical protein
MSLSPRGDLWDPESYLWVRYIGVWQAKQRVPYKAHHLSIVAGFDKQHSAIAFEQPGLLIGLPQ